MVGFCSGKSNLEMDDDWGYPYDSGNLHIAPFLDTTWTLLLGPFQPSDALK